MELYEYQESIAQMLDYPALFMGPGTGKTFTSLRRWQLLGKGKLLIVGLATKKQEWADDLVEFQKSYSPDDIWRGYIATGKAGNEYITEHMDTPVIITNFESMIRLPILLKWVDEETTIIFDESQKLKIPTSKATKMAVKLAERVENNHSLVLTGTPTSQGRWEHYFPQMQIAKADAFAGMKRTEFNKRFTVQQRIDYGSGFPTFKIVGYKNTKKLSEMIGESAVFLKRDAAYGLPTQEVRYFDAPGYGRDLYNKILHDRVLYEDDDSKETIVYDTIGKLHMGLRQASAGIVDGVLVDNSRITYLRDILESLEDERVVIFYTFNGELNAMKALLEAIGRPYSEFNGHRKDLSTFEEKSNSVALVNIKSGSTGINSLKIAHFAVFFSPPVSSEQFEQAKARLDRIGQTIAPYFYVFYSRDTVEEATWKTISKGEAFTLNSFEHYMKEQGLELSANT